jgi:ubiquinone/menaquinone biosynthesis C-methylase UbiE
MLIASVTRPLISSWYPHSSTGSGELTCRIADLLGKGGKIVGVDASVDMIIKARSLTDSQNVASAKEEFELVDGHDLERWLEEKELTGTFDKVFSSAAVSTCAFPL